MNILKDIRHFISQLFMKKIATQYSIHDILIHACREGDFEKVRYCLTSPEIKQHANIDYRSKIYSHATPLILACANGHMNIVEYLLTSKELKKHSRIHEQDKCDHDALMYACRGGHLDIVKYLLTSHELKEHAKIHRKNQWNALHWACHLEQEDVIFYLIIEHNMEINDELKNLCIQIKAERSFQIIEKCELYRKLHQTLKKETKIDQKLHKI